MAQLYRLLRSQPFSLVISFFLQGIFVYNSIAAETKNEMTQIPSGIYYPLYTSEKEIKSNSIGQPVESFWIDNAPVSNLNYLKFVKKNPKWKKSEIKSIFANKNYLNHWQSDLELGRLASNESPVTNISWFAARAYCKSLSKRLPTTAEWEYIASASEKRRYAAQSSDQFAKKILEWYGKPNKLPLPDRKKTKPNLYGVYDLHGLTWEWVLDFNTALVTGESRGDSTLERQLYCGSGALNSTDFKNYAAFMRYSFRSSLSANYCIENLSFRCAKDINKK